MFSFQSFWAGWEIISLLRFVRVVCHLKAERRIKWARKIKMSHRFHGVDSGVLSWGMTPYNLKLFLSCDSSRFWRDINEKKIHVAVHLSCGFVLYCLSSCTLLWWRINLTHLVNFLVFMQHCYHLQQSWWQVDQSCIVNILANEIS